MQLSALLAVLALSSGQGHAANVLSNANLDQIGSTTQNHDCPIGWVVAATKSFSGDFFDGGDSETWCNVSPPSDPSGYGFFFKPFQGSVGPPEDVLTVQLYQDNPATPGTMFTLSGYAAGEANYSGFFNTNVPAPGTMFVIQFFDSGGTSLASNAFDLVAAGLPNTGAGSMSTFLYTSPQVTAPANTATVRAGASIFNVYSTSGSQSFFVDSFDLEATAPAGSPIITNQPSQTSVPLGGNASFSVGISNPTGVSYQWQLANTNLSDAGEFFGTKTATLSVTGVSASDVGHYRVLVSNSSGSVYSSDATLTIVNANLYPTITVSGKVGDTYRVDYATALNPTTWIPLSTNKLAVSPLLITDTSYPQDKARFYRAVFLY